MKNCFTRVNVVNVYNFQVDIVKDHKFATLESSHEIGKSKSFAMSKKIFSFLKKGKLDFSWFEGCEMFWRTYEFSLFCYQKNAKSSYSNLIQTPAWEKVIDGWKKSSSRFSFVKAETTYVVVSLVKVIVVEFNIPGDLFSMRADENSLLYEFLTTRHLENFKLTLCFEKTTRDLIKNMEICWCFGKLLHITKNRWFWQKGKTKATIRQ